jgi:beta-amylase
MQLPVHLLMLLPVHLSAEAAAPSLNAPFACAAAAGNNVGDCCRISLPRWVLEAGERDPDIFFTDSSGYRNRECLSVGCGLQPVLEGRSPLQAQAEFIAAFADEFRDMLGGVVTEVTIGMGPAGELRYPSYPEGDGRWRFPGIGQFQCYDK